MVVESWKVWRSAGPRYVMTPRVGAGRGHRIPKLETDTYQAGNMIDSKTRNALCLTWNSRCDTSSTFQPKHIRQSSTKQLSLLDTLNISKTIDLLWCWVRILDSRSCSGTRCDAGLLWRSSGILSHWRAVVLGRVVICDCLDGALGNSRHRIAWT